MALSLPSSVASRLGAQRILRKPIDEEDLLCAVRQLLLQGA